MRSKVVVPSTHIQYVQRTHTVTHKRTCTYTRHTCTHYILVDCTFSDSSRVRLCRLVGCAWWMATERLGSSSEACRSGREKRWREAQLTRGRGRGIHNCISVCLALIHYPM